MTLPESCGETGGAVSLWINVIEGYPYDGILTTVNNYHSTGFFMENYGRHIA